METSIKESRITSHLLEAVFSYAGFEGFVSGQFKTKDGYFLAVDNTVAFLVAVGKILNKSGLFENTGFDFYKDVVAETGFSLASYIQWASFEDKGPVGDEWISSVIGVISEKISAVGPRSYIELKTQFSFDVVCTNPSVSLVISSPRLELNISKRGITSADYWVLSHTVAGAAESIKAHGLFSDDAFIDTTVFDYLPGADVSVGDRLNTLTATMVNFGAQGVNIACTPLGVANSGLLVFEFNDDEWDENSVFFINVLGDKVEYTSIYGTKEELETTKKMKSILVNAIDAACPMGDE